jgi:putative transposase
MSGHKAYELYAHITWHTWQRRGCVGDRTAEAVRTAVREAAERSAIRILRGAMLADHIHLLVSFRPDTRLADFVRVAKSVSARSANCRVLGSLRWARGYYVRSLSKADLPVVSRYIARQSTRHQDRLPGSAPVLF